MGTKSWDFEMHQQNGHVADPQVSAFTPGTGTHVPLCGQGVVKELRRRGEAD